ncbi:Uncharacterised protein [uncultured archaeon]|nr:Uncharacterised protein [uncultured archaeon]
MNDTVRLLVVLMIFWALIAFVFNFIVPAFSMPDVGASSYASNDISDNAQAMNPCDSVSECNPYSNLTDRGEPMVDLIYMGRGFALKNNESRSLFVSVQKVRYVDPNDMRRLMSSNGSIEALRDAIDEQVTAVAYNGDLRLSRNSYQLVNIKLHESIEDIKLDADLLNICNDGAEIDKAMVLAGHLIVTIPKREASEGDADVGGLTIDSGEYHGAYKVFLSRPEIDVPHDNG